MKGLYIFNPAYIWFTESRYSIYLHKGTLHDSCRRPENSHRMAEPLPLHVHCNWGFSDRWRLQRGGLYWALVYARLCRRKGDYHLCSLRGKYSSSTTIIVRKSSSFSELQILSTWVIYSRDLTMSTTSVVSYSYLVMFVALDVLISLQNVIIGHRYHYC